MWGFAKNYVICCTALLSPAEKEGLQKISNFIEQNKRPRIACLQDLDGGNKTSSSITSSRFGGRFAWPKQRALPFEDAFCLAQINLSDIPKQARDRDCVQPGYYLPESGILQVLIRGCDKEGMYGASWDEDCKGDGYRIVLHPADDDFSLQPSLKDMEDTYWKVPQACPDNEAFLMDGIPMKFRFDAAVKPNEYDYRIAAILDPLMFGGAQKKDRAAEPSSEFVEQLDGMLTKLVNDFHSKEMSADCWLWGHPDFTQDDVRRNARFAGYEPLISFSSQKVFSFGE